MILQQNRQNFNDNYQRIFGSPLKGITFIVTHDCNLKCTYCYEHNKDIENEMSLDTGKKCVDFLFESDMNSDIWINFEQAHGVILDFIGGEPLIKIELIDQIMDYFIEKAISLNHRWAVQYIITMTSNGMLYHTKQVQEFLHKWNGRVSISITVDGDKETHDSCRLTKQGIGSYDLASSAFLDLKQKYGLSGTKFTIAPGNVDKVFKASSSMIKDLDILSLNSNCVYEEGWTYGHATTLYYELKHLVDWLEDTDRIDKISLSIFNNIIGKPMTESDTQNWCGGTGKMLAFDVNGEILPCLRYSSLSLGCNRAPMMVGHIDTGIGKTTHQLDTITMLESITRQSQSTDECINCPIASGCAWCSAYNYEVFGTPNKRATFICPMHKARVLANVYYWNKYYRYIGSDEQYQNNVPDEWALEIISQEELNMLKALTERD